MNHNRGRSDTFPLLDLRHQSVPREEAWGKRQASKAKEMSVIDLETNTNHYWSNKRTLNKWCWKDAKVGWIKRTRKRRDAFGWKPVLWQRRRRTLYSCIDLLKLWADCKPCVRPSTEKTSVHRSSRSVLPLPPISSFLVVTNFNFFSWGDGIIITTLAGEGMNE